MSSVVQIQRKLERHIWESQYLPKSAMLLKRREQMHPRSSSRKESSYFLPILLQRVWTKMATDNILDHHWPPQVLKKLSKQRCPLSFALQRESPNMIWSALPIS